MLAVAIRVWLVARGWPGPADSDEATMGLMALHIANQGAHPLIFYGQHIVGPQEAYIGAAIFRVLGPSALSLRLGLVLLYIPFLVVMYLLARLLYSRGLALVVLLLLTLGSPEMLGAQLFAGGHAETPLYCAALVLLATWQSLAAARAGRTARRVALGWVGWAALAGFAVWGDPLVTPFVVASGAVLVRSIGPVAARRAVVSALKLATGVAIVLLMLVTALPSLASAMGVTGGARSLGWHGHGIGSLSAANVVGTLTESLPLALGANAVCPLPPQINDAAQPAQSLTIQSSWMGQQPIVWPPSPCGVVHAAWAVLALLLGVVAFTGAFLLYRKVAWSTRPRSEALATRLVARMALLGGAGLTLLIFVLSPAPATEPWTTRRYLVGMLVAMQTVVWPLYRRARRWLVATSTRRPLLVAASPAAGGLPVPPGARRRSAALGNLRGPRVATLAVLRTGKSGLSAPARVSRRALGVASGLLLVALTAVLAAGVAQTFAMVPAAQLAIRQQDDLIAHLTALGATRIYTDYWTCDRLAFASDERIVCATLDARLAPDFDRYPPYRATVAATSNPWYVFPAGSPQDTTVALRAATAGGWQRLSFSGYNAYRPPPRQADGPGAPATTGRLTSRGG